MAVAAAHLRILVAEDDSAVAKLYAAYAQGRGHAVTIARDGAQTLEAAGRGAVPDLILLDVAMPELDGRDVLLRLKADPRTAAIPVVVVSAFGADQNMRDQLVDLGASDVLEKPVDLRLAFDKVEQLAARRQA
jgi:CheY-like chemotaxis protein